MQLVVNGYNVKYVCVDVSGALLFLPVGFRFCTLGIFFSVGGVSFLKRAISSGLRFLVGGIVSLHGIIRFISGRV
jgi:hypothetical protein